MASFSGPDYDYLFALGQGLYYDPDPVNRKETAIILMAMVESVRGQQSGWPEIPRRYQHLRTYQSKIKEKNP